MSELNEIDGEGSAELEAITRMQDKLAAAIEGVRTESRDMALKAVEDFATKPSEPSWAGQGASRSLW